MLMRPQLDDWTEAHEAEEARKERERQAAMAGDGWTVVVRSKVPGARCSCGNHCSTQEQLQWCRLMVSSALSFSDT